MWLYDLEFLHRRLPHRRYSAGARRSARAADDRDGDLCLPFGTAAGRGGTTNCAPRARSRSSQFSLLLISAYLVGDGRGCAGACLCRIGLRAAAAAEPSSQSRASPRCWCCLRANCAGGSRWCWPSICSSTATTPAPNGCVSPRPLRARRRAGDAAARARGAGGGGHHRQPRGPAAHAGRRRLVQARFALAVAGSRGPSPKTERARPRASSRRERFILDLDDVREGRDAKGEA